MKKKESLIMFTSCILIIFTIVFINYCIYKNNNYYKIIANIYIFIWIIFAVVTMKITIKNNNLISPYSVYIFTISLFIFFPLIFDDIQTIYFPYYLYQYKSIENLNKSLLIIFSSSIVIFIVSQIFNKSRKSKINKVNEYVDCKKIMLLINTIIFVFVIFIDFKINIDTYGTLFGRITNEYSSLAKLSILRLFLYLYPMVIINYYYIICKYTISFKSKIFILIICLYIIIVNFCGGNRALILSSIIGIIILNYRFKGMNMKKIVIIMLITILTYCGFIVSQSFRMSRSSSINLTESLKWKYDTIDVTMVVVNEFPKKTNFTYGKSIQALILNFIPRKYFPKKPQIFGRYIAFLVNPHDPNTVSSYAAVMPIEFYSNFGFVGMLLFISILFIILQRIYIKYGKNEINDINTLIYTNFIVGLYMVFRGDFTSKTIHLLIPLLFFTVLKYFVYICRNIKIKK